MKELRRCWILMWFLLVCGAPAVAQQSPIEIGSRRELFLDHYLIEKLDHARLQLHEPRDQEPVLMFDRPWEGIHWTRPKLNLFEARTVRLRFVMKGADLYAMRFAAEGGR